MEALVIIRSLAARVRPSRRGRHSVWPSSSSNTTKGGRAALATPAGAVVRLELQGEDGALLQVELPRDRHEALLPQLGERLYLRPRQVRVFLDA